MLKFFCRQPPDPRVTVPFVIPKEGGMRDWILWHGCTFGLAPMDVSFCEPAA